MIERHEYPVSVTWTAETRGVVRSTDELPELTVAPPPEFGGPARVWSPEHLLVASVASCFMTTLLAIAGISRLEIVELEVPASGTLVRGDDRRYSIPVVTLRPRIVIADEAQRAKTERLAAKADEICLISRSLGGEVVLEPTIEVAAADRDPVPAPAR